MVAPAAVTVQVMNPQALLGTTGITYMGRSSAQYDLAGSTRTWNELGAEFVQFMAPRLCSAGKLAMRGVTMSSYPLDMNELADFRRVTPFSAHPQPMTWNVTNSTNNIKPAGWCPLVVYNPDAIGLQFLVTMEWRVRFDPSNPAAGSHRFHGTATDQTWDTMVKLAAAAGHGVMDIAERVAENG